MPMKKGNPDPTAALLAFVLFLVHVHLFMTFYVSLSPALLLVCSSRKFEQISKTIPESVK